MKPSLYYHTLRYLRPIQIIYQIKYHIRQIQRNPFLINKEYKGYPLSLAKYIDKAMSLQPDDSFTFLNINKKFKGWNHTEGPMLWTYNLNYMDYLLQTELDPETGINWITRFIQDQSTNKTGLSPYPIALRGINWIKFISQYPVLIPDTQLTQWNISLYAQYQILYKNTEYHLLGNHLLEDAFSLLWGGLYFRENKFYQKSVRLLMKELNEQILPDGAHYELSPMYHCILLDRLLDCINALKYNPRFKGQEYITSFLEEKARLMLSWLDAIVYKDGTIPLLNDSAYGIAPTAQQLFVYAELLDIKWSTHILKESGYRKFTSNLFEMVIDVGNIGPDYIPGHAHADTFNYELRIAGKAFIIDSGISTYEKNARRQYERETQAHNTVQVEGHSSSKVWGGFRVAQRAKIVSLKEDHNCITARHDGFKQLGIEHQRIFDLNDKEIMVCDTLQPITEKKGVNTIILHPDVKIYAINQDRIETNLATLSFYGADEIWIEDCEVAFEYNKLIPSKKICIAFTNQMQYTIQTD